MVIYVPDTNSHAVNPNHPRITADVAPSHFVICLLHIAFSPPLFGTVEQTVPSSSQTGLVY